MTKFAMVFPGQGSQRVGMLKELVEEFPVIKETFAQATATLGYDAWQLMTSGPEEQLNQTQFTQPILLAAGFAMWRAWCEAGGETPSFLAGHSLGEYTALVCAGAIDFADALRLVSVRGRLMQQAVPVGKGGMAVIIGLDAEQVAAICVKASAGKSIIPANYNSPKQIVVAGDMDAVLRVIELAKEENAKIAKMLAVSVPSHCPLMREAAKDLMLELHKINISAPKIAVVQNATVQSYVEADAIRQALVEQLYSPVRWVETIAFMINSGVNRIYECGPGKVLTGLIKRIDGNVSALAMEQVGILGMENR